MHGHIDRQTEKMPSIDSEIEDGLLSSIGFMFDDCHSKVTRDFTFGNGLTIRINLIGQEPGHVQSGQYLWPAAEFACNYIQENWQSMSFMKANTIIELGAGCGLAGITAAKITGARNLVLSDYDIGSLKLLRDNFDLNYTNHIDNISFIFENVPWGTPIPSSISDMIKLSSKGNSSCMDTTNDLLLLGTDLIYSYDIVEPLFSTVSQLLRLVAKTSGVMTKGCFMLVSSFDIGEVRKVAFILNISLFLFCAFSLDDRKGGYSCT